MDTPCFAWPAHPVIPRKNARGIFQIVSGLAGDLTRSTDTLHVIPQTDYAMIKAGDQLLMRVFDVDSGMPGVNHAGYAELVKNGIAIAILDYRQARTSRALLKDAGAAVAGAGLLILVLLSWTRLYPQLRLDLWIDI